MMLRLFYEYVLSATFDGDGRLFDVVCRAIMSHLR